MAVRKYFDWCPSGRTLTHFDPAQVDRVAPCRAVAFCEGGCDPVCLRSRHFVAGSTTNAPVRLSDAGAPQPGRPARSRIACNQHPRPGTRGPRPKLYVKEQPLTANAAKVGAGRLFQLPACPLLSTNNHYQLVLIYIPAGKWQELFCGKIEICFLAVFWKNRRKPQFPPPAPLVPCVLYVFYVLRDPLLDLPSSPMAFPRWTSAGSSRLLRPERVPLLRGVVLEAA